MSETGSAAKESKRWCHHDESRPCDESCFYRRMLAVIGKKYTLSVLRILMHVESARFNEIANQIMGSPKTLIDRLNELMALKIVHREAFAEIPPRVEYSLTQRGREMGPIMEAIRVWADRWWVDSPQ